VPLFTAPGSVPVPVLLGPAAVGAPEFDGSPAVDDLLFPVVPCIPVVEPSPELVPVAPVVVPFMEPPVVVPLAAGPPEEELPPAEFCASANVLDRANAVASTIVVSLMCRSSRVSDA
jgi:hypothetical protein